MKFRILVLFAVFAHALGQSSPTVTIPTEAPTTAAATVPSTTPPTTAATAAPTTAASSAAPPTTVITSTAAPPLTTVAPPPAPVPTPIPKAAAVHTWSIKDGDNYCFLLKAGIQFGIVYETTDGVCLNATINVPANATSPNNCSKTGDIQEYALSWLSENDQNYTMSLQFAPVPDDKGYSLCYIRLDFSYDASEFINATDKGLNSSVNAAVSVKDYELQSLQDSYMCMVDVYVNLTVHDGYTDTVRFTDLQFLAYGERPADDDFGYATECDADFTNSDIVPIAVGCALAALVVIVLIAYLIGRKRSRQKGYQSV